METVKRKKRKSDVDPELLCEAIAFAARAHQGQLRRDGKTPYVSHVFGVAATLLYVFGIKDPEMLIAALLHDTLEDTETSFKKLTKKFGRKTAAWVQLLSKDKAMPSAERERIYCRQLKESPDKVKIIKLADIYDNLVHSKGISKKSFKNFRRKARRYLRVLSSAQSKILLRPLELVNKLIE